MLTHRFSRLLYALALFSLLSAQAFSARAEVSPDEASLLLPDIVGDFHAQGKARPLDTKSAEAVGAALEDFNAVSAATRVYTSVDAQPFTTTLIKTRSDSSAYALLTRVISDMKGSGQPEKKRLNDAGLVADGFATEGRIVFFKGATFVSITTPSEKDGGKALSEFTIALAGTLDKGEEQIPVLVKHLPEWETARSRAVYAVSLPALQEAAGRRPVLDALSFEGGTEAVTATYERSRLVIVENTTPQLATTNDARITAKLKELSDSGQPLPSAYRRVGNYSVFVFDAPDEATAIKLIESIKYEQVVQWLGQNPYAYQRAVRQYTSTTAGVILAVLKASGISLLLCLGVGAVFGGIVFKRRRQQQTQAEAFSDAGGMVRLNLDEITHHYEPGKLLGPGEGR